MSISTLVLKAGASLPEEMQGEILRAIAGIEYGSVEIVIHERRVVQIEIRQKKRFEADGKAVR